MKTIVDAIRAKDFSAANRMVTNILQQKVFEVFDAERKALFTEGNEISTPSSKAQAETCSLCNKKTFRYGWKNSSSVNRQAICEKCFKKAVNEGYTTSTAPPKPENWDKGWSHPWRIGGGGKETPYLKNNKWKLYVWNSVTDKHAEYDFASDTFENED